MALATRCPNCQALFRVAAEQLRSRGGMVRCGSCRKVFNAIAGLDYLDAQRLADEDTGPRARPAAALPPPTLTAASAPAAGPLGGPAMPAPATAATEGPISSPASSARLPAAVARPTDRHDEDATRGIGAAPSRSSSPASAASVAPRPSTLPEMPAALAPVPGAAPAKAAPGERRRNPRPETGTLSTGLPAGGAGAASTGFRVAAPVPEETSEGQGAPFDTLFIVPRDEEAAEGDAAEGDGAPASDEFETPSDAPSFLQDAPPSPLARAAMNAGIVVLLPLLVAQSALIFRTPLVVAFPGMRPALQALCAPLSCTASWPMRPDLLAVVSSELQAVPGTSIFELDTVLRNRAAFPLALPAIELAISDNNGRAMARKVFLPAEYLGSLPDAHVDPAAASIAAGGDLAVRVHFELPGIGATNFEAYPFYP